MNAGFLGTGLMGSPMVSRLIEAGHKAVIYNRTLKKAEALRSLGADVAQEPSRVVTDSQCIILMLSDAKAIEDVLLDEKIPGFAGKTVIQMGTIAPRESIMIKQKVQQKGGEYLECPVLGSIKEVKAGKLLLMVGSDHNQFNKWKTFLSCFGPEPQHIGEVGQAAALKLAMNQLIASLMASFSLSYGLVERFGIDNEVFMNILRKSALFAPMFDNKLPRIQTREYDNPNFPTMHMLKDVNLFLSEAKANGLRAGFLEQIRELLDETINRGFSKSDYSSIYQSINPPGKDEPV